VRIVVFGATGGLGRSIVGQALSQGHEVFAVARHPETLALAHPQLSLAAADVLDAQRVRAAIRGCDGVIAAFGVPPGVSPGTLYSQGTRTIVDAMEAEGVRRLVSVSTWLVGESRRRAGPLVRVLVPLLQPELYRDRERQEDIVRASALDWIIVRPSRLTQGRPTGRYRAGVQLKLRATSHIGRADVAAFVLKQLDDDSFLRQAPTVST
jgi:putative NADH-flavin reductase